MKDAQDMKLISCTGSDLAWSIKVDSVLFNVIKRNKYHFESSIFVVVVIKFYNENIMQATFIESALRHNYLFQI